MTSRYTYERERIDGQVSVDRMYLARLNSVWQRKFIDDDRLRAARAALNPIFDEGLKLARNLEAETTGPESFYRVESGILVVPRVSPLIEFGRRYYDANGLVQEIKEDNTAIKIRAGIPFLFDSFSILPHARGGKPRTQLAGYGYLSGPPHVRDYQKILLSPEDRHVFSCLDSAECMDVRQLSEQEFNELLSLSSWR